MIHHVSIPAMEPKRVAGVLAELMGGRSFPFPGPVPGAWMAVSGDPHGTMVEVYPAETVLLPGRGEAPVQFSADAAATHGPFHFLLSVALDADAIMRLGAREGWRTRLLGRGAPGRPPEFHVIECWIENQFLVELAPKGIIAAYQAALQFEALERYFSNQAAA